MDSKKGGRWSDADLLQLKSMIDAGHTIPEIAEALGRTQEATRSKAGQHDWFAYPSFLFKGVKAPSGSH